MSTTITKFKTYLNGLAALWVTGQEVFASRTDFIYWMIKPNFYFDKKSPISNLKSLKGIVHVRQGLRAIEYSNGHLA